MYKKWLVIIIYLLALAAIVIYKEPIMIWLNNGSSDNLIWVFAAATLLAAVPAVPFGVIAGILGAKYGPVLGGILNVASSAASAVLLFMAVRVAFQEQGRQFAAKYKQLDKFMIFLERNAFMTVLTARLIPFVPAPLVNVASAISRMKVSSFLIATVIGKIPVMFVFALVGDQLFNNGLSAFWTLLIYLLFLGLIFSAYRWYRLNQ